MVDRVADLTAHNSTSSCYTQTCHRTSPGWTLRVSDRASNTTPTLFFSPPLSLSYQRSLSLSFSLSRLFLFDSFAQFLSLFSSFSTLMLLKGEPFSLERECVRACVCTVSFFWPNFHPCFFFNRENFFSDFFCQRYSDFTCVSVTYVKEKDKQKSFCETERRKKF